jgi:hypothetical protein
MFSIANRYALAEKATLDTREQKKVSGHPDHPSSSKGHDKKRKCDRSVNVVEQPRPHKEYRPRPGELEGFLDRICIFHTKESTRPRTVTDFKVLQMRSQDGQADRSREEVEDPKGNFPEAHKEVNYILVAPTSMSPRGSKSSQPERSWQSVLPPPSTLDSLRSPLPSTMVTTRTLYQSQGSILW